MMESAKPESTELTLNVVYEGAPRAGKTASLLALGRLLGRPVITPGESNGRTLYFDWMNFRAGQRMGQPIRSRAIAVPGQRELDRRRTTILSYADAVVFVADSSAEGFAATVEHFGRFRRELADLQPGVPILLQINKRDTPDCLERSEVVEHLGEQTFSQILESVAVEGTGVRESFVFAVSEAIKYLNATNRLYGRGQLGEDASRLTPKELLGMLLDLNLDPNAVAEGSSEPPLTERSPEDRFSWGTQPIEPIPSPDDSSS